MNVVLEILKKENTSSQIRTLESKNILHDYILDIEEMKLVGECKYHVTNCFDHSIKAIEDFEDILTKEEFFESHIKSHVKEYLEKDIDKDLKTVHLLKLALFIHDIGKPRSRTVDEDGRAHFKGHENVGADMSKEISKNLNLDEEATEFLFKMVKYHMVLLSFFKSGDLSKEKLYTYFNELKDDTIGVIILGYCDVVSTRRLIYPDEDVNILKSYMNYILTSYIYKYKKSRA